MYLSHNRSFMLYPSLSPRKVMCIPGGYSALSEAELENYHCNLAIDARLSSI